ncbi:MAG: cyclopropane-fatty-acyl-phospholipid synthase family protein [Hyphomonas sp.]|nr:cyclopropane-fatty-acyl-phospholipid synthase family protein [Hyphomonas sp.]
MNNPVIATPQTVRQLKSVPASLKLAAMILLRTQYGTLTFVLPNGVHLRFQNEGPGPDAAINVHNYRFLNRALSGGDVGFGESYMDGDWSTPDLTAVLRFFSANFDSASRLSRGNMLVRSMNMVRHALNRRNSKAGARKNIMAHYDLGNAFYEKWLDPSMTYSSAYFESPNQSLEQGQMRKYHEICERIHAGPGSHILEIGCGWGGFAEYAARHRGSRVTCLTISPAQKAYAEERMHKHGLSDRVEIRLEDYRDHVGTYDGVASIEMFEAVGEPYWPSYFAKVFSSLKEGARAALQIITIDDDLFPSYRRRVDFIQQHIFPGGMLISEKVLKEQLETAGLRHDGVAYFGQDYARTCREWSRAFNARWNEIQPMGFDEQFRRLWNFYLSYCEAGFSDGRINVGQFQVTRT